MKATIGVNVQELADRVAITDLIYRYSRAMDRMDNDLGYTLWHEDAWVDYGEDVYQGSGYGFIDWVYEQHAKMLVHQHLVSNIILTINGDSAASETCFHANLRKMVDGKTKHIATWGRYLDTWSRRRGRWAIDRREVIRDMDEIRDVVVPPLQTRGSRDRNDPSYALLRE